MVHEFQCFHNQNLLVYWWYILRTTIQQDHFKCLSFYIAEHQIVQPWPNTNYMKLFLEQSHMLKIGTKYFKWLFFLEHPCWYKFQNANKSIGISEKRHQRLRIKCLYNIYQDNSVALANSFLKLWSITVKGSSLTFLLILEYPKSNRDVAYSHVQGKLTYLMKRYFMIL